MDNLMDNVPIEIKNEILDLSPNLSWCVTKTNCITLCKNISCEHCLLNSAHTKGTVLNGEMCKQRRRAWLKSLSVDWTKVPIDTKILVRTEYTAKENEWVARHFAGMYTNDLGKTYPSYYASGLTSWTVDKAARIPVTNPSNIRLGVVEEEDNRANV